MSEWWNGTEVGDDGAQVCEQFQLDLSCLVDGELDEPAAARAMLHIEDCECCREFFDDTRRGLRLHLDATNPERLLARISSLTGHELATNANAIELVHKLATIFYQLGKAYVLTATDPGFRTRVFEDAVPIEPTQTQGRGFVDGVVMSRKADEVDGVDWQHARGMLNGRLKEIESPLEKGRRLLEEAIQADPSHEEARIYLAFLHVREGKRVQAIEGFQDVFETAINESNRALAAIHIGSIHEAEGNHRRALKHFRWVLMSGAETRDPRLFFVLFNIGLQYASLGDQRRSLDYFRRLIDRHPRHLGYTTKLVATSQQLRRALETRPGFAEALVARCPELVRSPSFASDEAPVGDDSFASEDSAS